MFKKLIILIICAVIVFQNEGLLSASENAEDKKEMEEIADVKTEVEEKTENVNEVEKPETNVVAIVNGEKIFRKDLDRRLEVFKRLNQKITKATEVLVIDQLAKKILLKQFINKQNIEVSDKEINGEIEKIEYLLKSSPNSSGKKLKEILESRGSNIEILKVEVNQTLALSRYLKKNINEGAMEDYFNANKIFFNGEKVRVSHILVDTRDLETKDELEEAKQKIEKIKKEIDNGADISELAKKHSDCLTAENGGDIGFFARRGSVVEPFAEAAFSLKIGEISNPFQTQFGYHILKVTDRQKGKDISYADAREMVEFVFMEIETENLVIDLVKKSKVERFL